VKRLPGHSETGRTVIERPRAEVWRLIVSLPRITEWYDGWECCEYPSDQALLHEGQTFVLRSRQDSQPPVRCQVVTVVEPSVVRWIEHQHARSPVLVEFRLEVPAPERTAVIHTKRPITFETARQLS